MCRRETVTPTTIPFWVRCLNQFHLFGLTTFTQVPRVSIGPRAGRSSAWFADAELLSARFRPALAKPLRLLRSPYAVVQT